MLIVEALTNCTTQALMHKAILQNRVALDTERLLLNDKDTGFLASGGDEFNPGPETRLDRSELLFNKVLLKYKGDRESF